MEKKRERRKQFLVNFTNRAANKGVRTNPVHFIFFDTETDQAKEVKHIGKKDYDTTVNTLQMGWCCYWNRETNLEEWFYFENIQSFQIFLTYVIGKCKHKGLWIVAHNVVFDNLIVDIEGYFKEKKYETDFIHAKGMVFLQKLKLKNAKGKTIQNVMLVNNGNIFPAKLEVIGSTVNLPKLEVSFSKDSKEYIKAYCKRDVEILVEFWCQWSKFIEVNNLGNIKYTISSQSMEAFKKKFCNEYILLDDDIENLSFERLAYFGGRTEIFHRGKIRKALYYYDVNSMYPWAMKSFLYPTEFKYYKENVSIEQMEYYMNKTDLLVIAECNINTKLNCYPFKSNHTLLFKTGEFTTYLATPEVKEALKNKDIVSFGRVSFYKGKNIFNDYIDFFYNLRLSLKKAGNKQEKMVKLFLNSLYGKFGQMMDSWIGVTLDDVKFIDPNFDFDDWIMDLYKIPRILAAGVNITPNFRCIGGQLQMSDEKSESQISFPAIAAHVTSYARLKIWNVIKYCQDHNIKYYYCDTDSIFTEGEIDPGFVDQHELGKFKIEKIYEHGVEFINLKNYCELDADGNKFVEDAQGNKIIMNDEVFTKNETVIKGSQWKMKGVPNSAKLIDENTFECEEWGGLPKQEYYKKFGRKPGEFWVITKTKVNHGNINKGTLEANGDITPFVN